MHGRLRSLGTETPMSPKSGRGRPPLIAGHRGGVLASLPAPLNVLRATRFGCVPGFHHRRRVATCVSRAWFHAGEVDLLRGLSPMFRMTKRFALVCGGKGQTYGFLSRSVPMAKMICSRILFNDHPPRLRCPFPHWPMLSFKAA